MILQDYSFLLSGGPGNNIHDQLQAFWTCYEYYQPGHEVYKKSKADLRYTLPIAIHGDEGRYLKKGNFMVCTVETLLGVDSSKKDIKLRKKPCTCPMDGALGRYGSVGTGDVGDTKFQGDVHRAGSQCVNDCGNEFLSKFLIFGMSSLKYKKHSGLLTQAFDMVAEDLKHLFTTGISIRGQTFYAATLGLKGDLKFHHQIGNLTRSYYNAGARANHPMCSLCMAGHDAVMFEDLSDSPAWMETLFFERPWKEGCMPSLASIPFQSSCPEAIFRLDLFHCYKVGLGRDLTGSTIIVLCQLGYFDFESTEEFNLPSRLQRAFGFFELWCKGCGKSPAIHSFSKSLLNYQNERAFAWANVKGSDNTLLTQWLIFTVKLAQQTQSRHPKLESALVETLEAAKTIFDILHSHSLWLDRACAQRVQHYMTVLLRGFKVLATLAKSLNVPAYALKPKLHACDHINRDLKRQLSNKAPKVLNPLAFSCEANESIIGHISRLSRRVNSRTVSCRVLDCVCIKVKNQVVKFKASLRLRRDGGHQRKRR